MNLEHAAGAFGYSSSWITDWYSYDPQAVALFGLTEGETVAGFIHIGTLTEPALERPARTWPPGSRACRDFLLRPVHQRPQHHRNDHQQEPCFEETIAHYLLSLPEKVAAEGRRRMRDHTNLDALRTGYIASDSVLDGSIWFPVAVEFFVLGHTSAAPKANRR
jgi:hypothetical protein